MSVRYRLHAPTAQPFSEAAGAVQSVRPDDSGALRIEIVTRRGELRAVPVADVIAATVL